MTEPPDDDELREFLESEQFDELEDDILLDRLGRGEDNRSVHDDMPDEDWELEDSAHDWKDDIDGTPLPPKLDPDALIAEYERRQEAAKPSGPRTPQEGSTPAMSLSEVIARLQMVASNSAAEGPIAQAKAKIDSEVTPLLMQAVEQLVEIKNNGVAALEGNVNTHAELQGAAEHVAGAIEDAIAQVQLAGTATGQAGEYEAAFRQTAQDIANRLAGG